MDEVEVSDGGVDQGLKRRDGDTLNDARPQQTVVATACAGPGARHDEQDDAEQVQMPLAPDSCEGHEQEPGNADPQQMISRQEGDGRKVFAEEESEREGVGGENRTQGHGHDRRDREDDDDEIPFP